MAESKIVNSNVDAAVLSQLMAAQTVLHTLPTTARITEFVAHVLEYIPSVQSCAVCIYGQRKPSGKLQVECSENCRAPEPELKRAVFKLCTPKNGEETIPFLLGAEDLRFGQILIATDNRKIFESIRPFISNFVNLTSIVIENKWNQKRITRQQTFLETILDTIENGIVACDENGILSTFNRATRLFHGINEENLPPEEWAAHYDLYLGDGKTLMKTEDIPLFRAFQGEHVNNSEIVIASKNGSKRFLLASGKELRDHKGNKLGAVVSMSDITERKKIEDDLKKTNEELIRHKEILQEKILARTTELTMANEELRKFEYIVSSSKDMQALLNTECIYLTANGAYLAAFQKKREDIVGHSVSTIFGKVFFDTVIRPHAEACLGGRDVRYQDWFEFPGTGRKYMDVAYSPYFGTNGEILGFVVTTRDITAIKKAEIELRRSEQALRENEELLKKAQGMAHIGNWKLDLSTNTLSCSDEIYRILGLVAQGSGATYETFLERVHPDDRALVKAAHSDSLEDGGTPFNVDYRIICPGSAEVRHVHQKCEHEKDASGRVVRSLGTVQDITERKKREAELRYLRNYLTNIIDSMPSVVVGVDIDGRVTQWNRMAEQVTGVTASKASNKKLTNVFPQMAAEMGNIVESIQSRQTQHQLKRSRHTQEGTNFEEVTIYPLIANGVEGAVIRVDDVTQKVRMEEMMIQSEKMLSLGGLAAGMAHEINNPLAAMMQTASVMANRLGKIGEIPANIKAAEEAGTSMEAIKNFMEVREIHRMIATIVDSGRRVAGVVDNMLSFARKSSAGMSSLTLADILDKTLELATTDYDLKKRYDFKLVEVKKEYEANLPPLLCDEGKIQQVLLNVLRNSAQAMGIAKTICPRITVRAEFEKAEKMIRIEIEDNGPGMSEEVSKRVFEPFYTTKSAGVGTGLGLSVSYFIVTENHGGLMSVETQPGAGAKFIIRLPLKGNN